MLHVFMALMRLLLGMLVEECKRDVDLMVLIQNALISMGLKLPETSKKDTSKKLTLEEKIKKARFQRTDFITIANNKDKLFEAIAKADPNTISPEELNKVTFVKAI